MRLNKHLQRGSVAEGESASLMEAGASSPRSPTAAGDFLDASDDVGMYGEKGAANNARGDSSPWSPGRVGGTSTHWPRTK